MQKVLIIEDNPDARRLVCYVLRRHGYDVLEAGSGEEALEMAGEDLPAFVLLDINLPGIDGLETARRLRSLGGGWASVPIIALTAVSMRGEREKILAAGCNDYLEKPYDPLQLIQQIRAIVGE
jgi:two-component system, cell cycle response regulator DivK